MNEEEDVSDFEGFPRRTRCVTQKLFKPRAQVCTTWQLLRIKLEKYLFNQAHNASKLLAVSCKYAFISASAELVLVKHTGTIELGYFVNENDTGKRYLIPLKVF